MTQAAFASISGYSERVVSYYCSGERRMSPEAMFTASSILKVPMDQFYEWIKL
ncbi:helix-turn-helix transcriptional regulator [Paenibacillus sp. P3E]|uniref:helix-turn-helix domain-containing protein n=1 Tax=Paenibacillus sp. P3E TaxID=1349435 RepID=UPI00093F9196